jgi:hypothetical protein
VSAETVGQVLARLPNPFHSNPHFPVHWYTLQEPADEYLPKATLFPFGRGRGYVVDEYTAVCARDCVNWVLDLRKAIDLTAWEPPHA